MSTIDRVAIRKVLCDTCQRFVPLEDTRPWFFRGLQLNECGDCHRDKPRWVKRNPAYQAWYDAHEARGWDS